MTESGSEQAGDGVLLSEGIMQALQPVVERLDSQVHATRVSQYMLNTQIQTLAQHLKDILDDHQMPYDLDVYVRKLDDSKRRVNSVSNTLQNVHDRLSRLQRNIARQTYHVKQRTMQQIPEPEKS